MANSTGFRATRTFNNVEEADFCEHCSAKDLSKAVGYFYERDSFGLVSLQIVCHECREAIDTAEQDMDTTCEDCLQTVKVKDTIQWRGYDYDPNQGDEPKVICNCCKELPKHLERIESYNYRLEQDRQDNEAWLDDDIDDDEPEDDALDPEDDIPEEHWDDLR